MRRTAANFHSALPFLSVVVGIAVFCVMDALMKRASITTGVYVAMLGRNIFGALLMLPLWQFSGGRLPRGAALKVHLTRSAAVAVMAPLWFWGLVRLPMAEAIALSFIAPLIALYLAAVLLGERIQSKAIAGSILGFTGVIVIAAARLDHGKFDAESAWGIAAILGSSVAYAWNLILQRQQAQVASPQEIALFQNVFVALFLGLAAPWLAQWPAPGSLGDIVGSAVCATTALLFLSWGYARAEAQVLLPIEYTAFVWAALFGWIWFGETVGMATIAGVALIVAACWIAARGPTEHTAL
jgi:S-adenosylmethionine uptake transporter